MEVGDLVRIKYGPSAKHIGVVTKIGPRSVSVKLLAKGYEVVHFPHNVEEAPDEGR